MFSSVRSARRGSRGRRRAGGYGVRMPEERDHRRPLGRHAHDLLELRDRVVVGALLFIDEAQYQRDTGKLGSRSTAFFSSPAASL